VPSICPSHRRCGLDPRAHPARSEATGPARGSDRGHLPAAIPGGLPVGILRLAKGYGSDRLEAACERALAIGAHSYTSLASILKNGLDRQAPKEPRDTSPLPAHPNLRGAGYYH
jgi:hypothetical protein